MSHRDTELWRAIQAAPWVGHVVAVRAKCYHPRQPEQPLVDLIERALDEWPLSAVDEALDEYEHRHSDEREHEYEWQERQEFDYVNPRTYRRHLVPRAPETNRPEQQKEVA